MAAKKSPKSSKPVTSRGRKGQLISSLVIAEQIREEAKTQKLFVIGAYGGNQIVLHEDPPNGGAVLPLAFYFQLTRPFKTDGEFWILNPAGKKILSARIIQKDESDTTLYPHFMVSGGMMLFESLGDYQVGVSDGEESDSRTLRIKRQ